MDEETKRVINQFFAQLQRNAGYLARQEISVILEGIRSDPKRLEHFGFKVYSQNDEDGIIEQIFRRLNTTKGQFCEIGVESGLESNTLYLIHKGWRGSWIEANIKRRDNIENKFASLIRNGRLRAHFELATVENINDLFKKVSFDSEELDFLSIDIDGNDIYLMEAIGFCPKVICIEYNAKFPPQISKKQTYNPQHFWRGTDYMGSSLLALKDVASKKGYTLVGTNITGANAFFVRNDCIENNFSENSTVAYLYNPPRYWLTFDHFARIGHSPDFGDYVDLLD
jgi:hypothetical protein